MLDDLLRDDLDLVVCGTAAGAASAARRQYYAGPGNKFWRTLALVGLTDRELAPAEFMRLSDYGIGLTDLVKGQSGSDSSLRFADADSAKLRAAVMRHQPKYLCFNGKRAAKQFFSTKVITFGVQAQTIGKTILFVAPSTSGAANRHWDADVWRELGRLVRDARGAGQRVLATGGSAVD